MVVVMSSWVGKRIMVVVVGGGGGSGSSFFMYEGDESKSSCGFMI